LKDWSGQEGSAHYWAVSPDGRWLVTSHRLEAVLWDLTAVDTRPLRLNSVVGDAAPGVVRSVQNFSEDGRWLVTVGNDACRLWDLLASDPTATSLELPTLWGQIEWACFTPGGRWLVGCTSETVYLWAIRSEELLDLAARSAVRNLTAAEWSQFFGDQPYRRTVAHLPAGLGEAEPPQGLG
jgi:WD40 repeat protein